MKDFFAYFFGRGTQQEFAIFTFAHLAPVLCAGLLIFFIFRMRNMLSRMEKEPVFRYILAFALIFAEFGYYWRLVNIPELSVGPVENLPLALCGWCAIFGSFMLVGKSQTLFDLIYFWLFSGSLFAVITPTALTYTGPTRFRYYQFWAAHLLGYVAVFYMIFVHKIRPTIKSAAKSYIGLLIMVIIAYFVNNMLPGANYLYIARPESAPSVLDILPEFYPLRMLIMASAITAMYALAYLPWYLKDRKMKKTAA